MIESPVTPYEIKRSEFAVILSEDQERKRIFEEEFDKQMWKEMVMRRNDVS